MEPLSACPLANPRQHAGTTQRLALTKGGRFFILVTAHILPILDQLLVQGGCMEKAALLLSHAVVNQIQATWP